MKAHFIQWESYVDSGFYVEQKKTYIEQIKMSRDVRICFIITENVPLKRFVYQKDIKPRLINCKKSPTFRGLLII